MIENFQVILILIRGYCDKKIMFKSFLDSYCVCRIRVNLLMLGNYL